MAQVEYIQEDYQGRACIMFKADGKFLLDGRTGDVFRFHYENMAHLRGVRAIQDEIVRICRAIDDKPTPRNL